MTRRPEGVNKQQGKRNLVALGIVIGSLPGVAHALQSQKPPERLSNSRADQFDRAETKHGQKAERQQKGPKRPAQAIVGPRQSIPVEKRTAQRNIRGSTHGSGVHNVYSHDNKRDARKNSNRQFGNGSPSQQRAVLGKPFETHRKGEKKESSSVYKLLGLLEQVSKSEAQTLKATLVKVINGAIPNRTIESIQQEVLETLNASIVRMVQKASPSDLAHLAALDFDGVADSKLAKLISPKDVPPEQMQLAHAVVDKINEGLRLDQSPDSIVGRVKDLLPMLPMGLVLTSLIGLTADAIRRKEAKGKYALLAVAVLLTACGVLTTPIVSPTSPRVVEIQPEQNFKDVSGLNIEILQPSSNLTPDQRTELILANGSFIDAHQSNSLVFPKKEGDLNNPLDKGGIVEALSTALNMPKESISLDNVIDGFLPKIIKFGNEGELMIQRVVYINSNGQEQTVMFARGNGTDWGLVGFTNQPFDVFSSSGNGVVVQGIDQMFTAFSGQAVDFTGLLVSGGRNGVVFSEALYFQVDDSGRFRIVLRDENGTLSGPAEENTLFSPQNGGVFNASFLIDNPVFTATPAPTWTATPTDLPATLTPTATPTAIAELTPTLSPEDAFKQQEKLKTIVQNSQRLYYGGGVGKPGAEEPLTITVREVDNRGNQFVMIMGIPTERPKLEKIEVWSASSPGVKNTIDVYTVPVILQDSQGNYFTVKVILGVPGQRLGYDFNPGQVLRPSGTSTAEPIEQVLKYLAPNRQHLIELMVKITGEADLTVPWINNVISAINTFGPTTLEFSSQGSGIAVLGVGSQIRLNGSPEELSP